MKRFLGVFLSLILALGLVVPSAAAAEPFYPDVPADHPAQAAIQRWSGYKLILGNDKGNFDPDGVLTRAALSTILNRVMGYQTVAKNTFSDLAEGDWYYDAVLRLNAAGVLEGSEGKAMPNQNVTRQEAVALVGRTLQLTESDKALAFTDKAKVADWADGYLATLVAQGCFANEKAFRPTEPMTRAETVSMLDTLITSFVSKDGDYSADAKGSVVVNAKNVTLKNMKIAGDLIIADGVGDGTVTLDNVTIVGQTIVRGGGEHSVIFNNVNAQGGLVVRKVDGKIRIVATGDTRVTVTKLESGAIVVGNGFESITIEAEVAKDQNIVLEGNFKSVTNNATDANIQATGKIDIFNANASTTISGGATIKNIKNETTEKVDIKVNGKDTSISAGGSQKPPNNNNVGGGGSAETPSTPTELEAAKYVNSVTIPKITPSSKNITALVKVLKSGREADSTVTLTITEKTDVADYLTVVNSVVTLAKQADNADGSAILTLTFTKGSYTSTLDVSVSIEKQQEPDYGFNPPTHVDARFADGYPKAEIVIDMSNPSNAYYSFDLKVQLKEASEQNPVKVYSVLSTYNTDERNDPDATAVLHGHIGKGQEYIHGTSAGYQVITDTEVHVYRFNYRNSVLNQRDAKIHMVLVDGTTSSAQPTTLYFHSEIIDEGAAYAPNIMEVAYANKARTQFNLISNQDLDTNSVPAPSAFTITGGGTVTAVRLDNTSADKPVIHLTVAGLAPDTDVSALTVNYTAPESNPLRGITQDTPNVASFETRVINAAPKLTSATLSADKKHLYVTMEPSISGRRNGAYQPWFNISLNSTFIDEHNPNTSYDWQKGLRSGSYVVLDAPVGSPCAIATYYELDTAVTDWAGDPVVNSEISATPLATALEITSATLHTAVEADDQSMIMTFNQDLIVDSSIASCSLNVTVNGTVYTIRGGVYPTNSSEGGEWVPNPRELEIRFGGSGIPVIAAGDTVTLSYHPQHSDMWRGCYPSDIAGAPIADFTDFAVTIPPTE